MRPLSSDLREFIHLLNTKCVKYVIVGAWALAFHGRPRYTGDLDVFVAREQDNADRLMEVIEACGFGRNSGDIILISFLKFGYPAARSNLGDPILELPEAPR